MRLGLALPQFDYSVPGEDPLRWDTVADWAGRAERSGFEQVWLADHLFLSLEKYGGPDRRFGTFDPLIALGGLAAVTDTVRLGTLVACGPLRPPALLAKVVTSLDQLAAGRLTVGVGAGWYEPDFSAAGVPFEAAPERIEQLCETVQVLKGMAAGEPFTHTGRWFRTEAARARPPAVAGDDETPALPVWIGGKGGDRLLAAVATVADGWNTAWRWTPADYAHRVDALHRACDRVGRDPATVTRTVGLTTLVGESVADLERRFQQFVADAPPGTVSESLAEFRHGRLVGTVDEVAAQLREWDDLGVAQVVCGLGAVPFSVSAGNDIELVASASGKEHPHG